MTGARNYFAWQSALVTRELGRRVVEVGCGVGNFTANLLDREAVIAVDAEPLCIERIERRYPGQANLHTIACDVAGGAFAGLARFRPDSCVCLNVLEHVENDYQALCAMASVVVPGGVIVLLVPAFPSLYGPIDRRLGHYRRYRLGSLAALAESAGLRVRKLHYLNAIGFFGWWTNSHIFRREAQSRHQIEVFDRYLVPVVSHLEAWLHPPFGQSLFAVLQKA